jgi:hypothetical protein
MEWTTIISSFLNSQAFGVIIGGSITFGANYLTDRRKSKDEETRRREDREAREIKFRNEAYIGFLSIEYDNVHPRDEHDYPYFDPDVVNQTLALAITHGSPKVWSEPLRVDNELSNFHPWRDVDEENEAALRPGIQDISSG